MKIVFDWGVSSYYAWGLYGLNLALQWAERPHISAACAGNVNLDDLVLDPAARKSLEPFALRSGKGIPEDALWLHALGHDMGSETMARVGVAVFEQPLSPEAILRAKNYDLLITASAWNEEVLLAAGIKNVRTVRQGIDPAIFHPAPKRNVRPKQFLIFSGGKAELRKGQDLVVKAFRIFAEKYSEAVLVTAWRSPWPSLRGNMDLDLSAYEACVIDVGTVANPRFAPIYRECDVALFPNRAEGGTNQVAMECIACGVPTILSANTGHRDIMHAAGVIALRQQTRVDGQWSEWGESDIDEIIAALERVHSSWRDGKREPASDGLEGLTWQKTANELFEASKHFAPSIRPGDDR
jgi:glycosyltransferase involved in cell wall biosynthesis